MLVDHRYRTYTGLIRLFRFLQHRLITYGTVKVTISTAQRAARVMDPPDGLSEREEPVSKRAFTPVVWNGKAIEPATTSEEAAKESSLQVDASRLKPNPKFLNNCIRQAVVGNQREIAANATKAACQVVYDKPRAQYSLDAAC